MGIESAEACDDWNMLDGDGSLWELFWKWLTSLFAEGRRLGCTEEVKGISDIPDAKILPTYRYRRTATNNALA